MQPIARIGDIGVGVCCAHDGCKGVISIVITGSFNVTTNNRPTARLIDLVIGSCGHIGIIITSAIDSTVNNRGIATIGSLTCCPVQTILVTGSSDTVTSWFY